MTRYGRKDDWDRQLPLAVSAINKAASTLGDGGDEAPALYTRRMRAMELTVRELLAAAQQEHKAKLDAGRVDTVFKGVLLRTKELLSTRPTWASCGRGGTAP